MVTIPTIDQISGTTVMNKMRSLIHAFINFATDVDDEITEFESTVTQDFYTKLEVDTKFADYYTKSQIDAGWYTKFEIQNEVLVNYYTKTQVDGIFDGYYTKTQIDTTLASYYTKTETDTLLDAKQGTLTAGDNITIVNDVISATGGGSAENWVVYNGNWSNYFSYDGIGVYTTTVLEDCILHIKAHSNRHYYIRFYKNTKVIGDSITIYGDITANYMAQQMNIPINEIASLTDGSYKQITIHAPAYITQKVLNQYYTLEYIEDKKVNFYKNSSNQTNNIELLVRG